MSHFNAFASTVSPLFEYLVYLIIEIVRLGNGHNGLHTIKLSFLC